MLTNASVIVHPENLNVIYIGVANPLYISIPGIPCRNIIPEIDHGEIKKKDKKCKYNAYPKKKGIANIRIKARLTEGGEFKYIGLPVKFRVKNLPDPYVELGGKISGTISMLDIFANPILEVSLSNFEFKMNWKIKSFSLSALDEKNLIKYDSHNNQLTKEQIELIKSLKDSSKIYITNAIVIGPDRSKRKLKDALFTIINKKD